MTPHNEIEASVVEVEKPKRQELWIPIYLSRESAEAVLKEDPGAFDALIHVPAESEPSPAREVDAVGELCTLRFLAIVALKHAEISEGRAVELTKLDRYQVRELLSKHLKDWPIETESIMRRRIMELLDEKIELRNLLNETLPNSVCICHELDEGETCLKCRTLAALNGGSNAKTTD